MLYSRARDVLRFSKASIYFKKKKEPSKLKLVTRLVNEQKRLSPREPRRKLSRTVRRGTKCEVRKAASFLRLPQTSYCRTSDIR